MALGRHDLSLEDAEAALELQPDWGKGHYRVGIARQRLGDGAGALAAMRDAVGRMAPRLRCRRPHARRLVWSADEPLLCA